MNSTGLEPASLGFAPIAERVAHMDCWQLSSWAINSIGRAVGAKPRLDAGSNPVESTFFFFKHIIVHCLFSFLCTLH